MTDFLHEGIFQLFTPTQWKTLMIWYTSLCTVVGGLLALGVVRMGYMEMFAAASGGNPASRASFIDEVKRFFIAMAAMALIPVFIQLLVLVNNSVVKFVADVLNNYVSESMNVSSFTDKIASAGVFEKIFLPTFTMLADFFHKLLGLKPISDLIFNGHTTVGSSFLADLYLNDKINTNNELANVMLKLAFIGFSVYFNAIFTIRKWVIAINIAIAPIVVWGWAVSNEKTILEIWIAEIIETVFKQMFYAISFAILFSLMAAKTLSTKVSADDVAATLKNIAFWLTGFGGAIALLIAVYIGFRIMTSSSSEELAVSKLRLQRLVIGLLILGLAAPITGFLAGTFSGDWGVNYTGVPGGGQEQTVSVWETFFMLVTLIPVAKALSSMFKSLVARYGTVEEEGVAIAGLGALAAVGGVAKNIISKGRTLGFGGKTGGTGFSGPGGGGVVPPSPSGGSPAPSGTVAEPKIGETHDLRPVTYQGTGGRAEGYKVVPKPEYSGLADAASKAEKVSAVSEKYHRALGHLSAVGLAGAGRGVAETVGGFTGNVMGAGGRAIGSMATVAAHSIKEFGKAIASGSSVQDFFEQYTSSKTKIGGAVAIGAATVGSVFGSNAAIKAQKMVLKAEDKIINWRNRPAA